MIELNIKEIFVNISGKAYLLVWLCALYGTAMKKKYISSKLICQQFGAKLAVCLPGA